MLKDSYVARIYTYDLNGNASVGTGYPISPNLLITARHVVDYKNVDKERKIDVVWDDVEIETINVSYGEVVKESSHNDQRSSEWALIKCRTPAKEVIDFNRIELKPHQKHRCCGYPIAGENQVEDEYEHELLSFTGVIESRVRSDGVVFELSTTDEIFSSDEAGHRCENWKGISGAPIEVDGRLVGIIFVKHLNVHKKLYGLSISGLIDNFSAFKDAYEDEVSKATRSISQVLVKIKPHIITLLSDKDFRDNFLNWLGVSAERKESSDVDSCVDLIKNRIVREGVQFLKKYRETLLHRYCYESAFDVDRKTAESIESLYILSYGLFPAPPVRKSHDTVYVLGVRTRFGVELNLALEYGVDFDFMGNEKSSSNRDTHVGQHSISSDFKKVVDWTAESSSSAIIRDIYKSIFKCEAPDQLDKFDYDDLMQTIENKRSDPVSPGLIRYEVLNSDVGHPINNIDGCIAELKSRLENLIIVRYGDRAMDNEASLLSEFRSYYESYGT